MNPERARSRWLFGLTVAVLAAHLWLLNGATHSVPAPSRSTPPSLLMRTIVSTPAAAPARSGAAPATRAERPTPPVRNANGTDGTRAANAGRAPAAIPGARAMQASSPASQAAGPTSAPTAVAAAETPAARQAGPPPTAATVAPSMRLHYKVTAFSKNLLWHGDGDLDWRHDGSSYEAKLEVSAPLLPTRTQRSVGKITPEGLAPIRFSDKARSEQAAHFERDKGKVSFSSNRPDALLLVGAQDRLSVMLQLGAIIAAGPRKFQPADVIEIQTAGTRDAEPWFFVVEGEERLQLPGGSLTALKLTRNPRREFDQKVELWLSPAMAYVPVRLRLTQPNGDWVDQQWSSTDKG